MRSHHERWAGGGYPDGLAGDAIPDGARVIAVADAWDAITSWRPYGTPRSVDEAIAECRQYVGTQFWPPAVTALEQVIREAALATPRRGPVGAVLRLLGRIGRVARRRRRAGRRRARAT